MIGADGKAKAQLSAGEMQLLSLLSGRLKKGVLALSGGTLQLLDAGVQIRLEGNVGVCSLKLRCRVKEIHGSPPERTVKEDVEALLKRLSAYGCDALGLGRQAMRHFPDTENWYALNWPLVCSQLTWNVSVEIQEEA